LYTTTKAKLINETNRKHSKSIIFTDGFSTEIKFIGKLIIGKFIDDFFSLSVIIDGFIDG